VGQYSFPFSFVLGEHLPGSFEKRWHEHGHEAYGKIKYKIKAGMKAKEYDSKIFGKKKIIIDEKYEQGKSNLGGPMVEKKVQGYCYTSHGTYKMAAIFSNNKYIVGDTATMSVAVDATEASTDIKELRCEFVMRTELIANGRSGLSKEKIQIIDLGRVEAGKAWVNENSKTVQLQIRTPGEMQASASGRLVRNYFNLQFVADVDGCVCCDQNPKSKVVVGVYNKHFGIPSNPGTFMGDIPWNPQKFDPYFAQLNDNQFKMDANFKQAYKPINQVDE
jgi:hypothetical protein